MTDVSSELSLMLRDGTQFSEADLAKATAGQFPGFSGIDGSLTLTCGGKSFSFGDNLLYVMTELCTVIAPQLTSDGSAEYFGFSHEEEITLTRSGDVIEISSAYRQGVSLPADATIAALADAAQRFAAMLPNLWTDGSPEQIAEFQTAADAAKDQLA